LFVVAKKEHFICFIRLLAFCASKCQEAKELHFFRNQVRYIAISSVVSEWFTT